MANGEPGTIVPGGPAQHAETLLPGTIVPGSPTQPDLPFFASSRLGVRFFLAGVILGHIAALGVHDHGLALGIRLPNELGLPSTITVENPSAEKLLDL